MGLRRYLHLFQTIEQIPARHIEFLRQLVYAHAGHISLLILSRCLGEGKLAKNALVIFVGHFAAQGALKLPGLSRRGEAVLRADVGAAAGEAAREAQAAASHLTDQAKTAAELAKEQVESAASMARSQAEMAADAAKKAAGEAKKDSADFATALKHDVLEAQMAMMTSEQRADFAKKAAEIAARDSVTKAE